MNNTEHIYVGMRVADLPVPHVPSDTRICQTCRNDVWISKLAGEDAALCQSIMCVHCMVESLKEDET